jgi:hypothetical protein
VKRPADAAWVRALDEGAGEPDDRNRPRVRFLMLLLVASFKIDELLEAARGVLCADDETIAVVEDMQESLRKLHDKYGEVE